MRKFLAIVKREWIQRVRSKMFILITVLGPLVISFFGIAPALIFSIQAGGPLKIAVVDETGKLYRHFYDSVTENARPRYPDPANANLLNKNTSQRFEELGEQRQNSFELEEISPDGRSLSEIKQELDARVLAKDLDGYLIFPANLLEDGKPEYFGRNTGDVLTTKFLQEALSRAVRQQRLAEANIDEKIVEKLSEPVELEAMKVGATGGV